jgi:uncharacterized protein YdaU (DUF1376 family)
MATEQAPAFQFYPRDFIADGDQMAMTLEEVGAYTRMLAHAWMKVGLPNDISKIARMINGPEAVVEMVLREHFTLIDAPGGGTWRNERQEEERKKQAKFRKQQGLKSVKGNKKRWGNTPPRGDAPGTAQGCPDGPFASASASAFASASADCVEPAPAEHTAPDDAPPKPTMHAFGKPLGYRSRIDVAWPGRVPVPGSLHAEFRDKLGGDPAAAEAKLRAWYPIAAEPYANQPIGDDDYGFWRARFREWVGTTVRSVFAVAPEPVLDNERMIANLRKRGIV